MKTTVGLACLGVFVMPCLSAEMNARAKKAFDEAFELEAQQKHVEALQCYELALKEAPDSQNIWQESTICLRNLNRLQSAARAGWRALELGDETQGLWGNLGNVFMRARAWDAAMMAFQKADALAVDKMWATKNFVNLGFDAWSAGANDKAEAALKYALKLMPDDCLAMIDTGFLHASIGRVAEGRKEIQDAVDKARKAGRSDLVDYGQFGLGEISKQGKMPLPPPEIHYQALPDRFLTRPKENEAQAVQIDTLITTYMGVPYGGRLSIQVPEEWGQTLVQPEPRKMTFFFKAARDDAFLIMISPIPLGYQVPDIEREVKQCGTRALAGAVEKRIHLIEVNSKTMHGYAYQVTDKNLVGRPFEKGNYPFMIQGMFESEGIQGIFTIEFRTNEKDFIRDMLKCISSITNEEPPGSKTKDNV